VERREIDVSVNTGAQFTLADTSNEKKGDIENNSLSQSPIILV
jgi:hypothetical protein